MSTVHTKVIQTLVSLCLNDITIFLSLIDNVFAPCDCEDNIEDEEEREVEAFKRLCFHSHAKPRKIKIAAPPVPEALKIR